MSKLGHLFYLANNKVSLWLKLMSLLDDEDLKSNYMP